MTDVSKLELTSEEIKQVNDWVGYFTHQPTESFALLLSRPEKYICYFTGNQKGKTVDVAMSYVMRILGVHPVEKKNMRPNKPIRIYRFASEKLPTDPEGGEIKNTQYPAFKKWLPPSLIKKDITIRDPKIVIRDPQGGPDVVVEFVSYGQTLQSQAGVQRESIWLDEHASQTFFDESVPRLLAADGDLMYTLTPALDMIGWEYDRLFERAKVYARTKHVADRMTQRSGKPTKLIEYTNSSESIAVVQAATDDNPTLPKEVVEEMFSIYDEDMVDIRRYGLFRHVSGLIFKDFEWNIHALDLSRYFDEIPPWKMGRFIDYHEQNPWAISFIAISPEDEAFVFNEYDPAPDKFVTLEIARHMAQMSGYKKFARNLMDPLANKNQANTGTTVMEDMNRYFREMQRDGECTGGYWQSWDTRSTRGRDEIRRRLKNSRLVGKPFNNKVVKDGRTTYLPTLWFSDRCKQHLHSMKNWRIEQWGSPEALVTKDQKDKPQQKWSHFPMCLEAAFKDRAFNSGPYGGHLAPARHVPQKKYFKGRRAA